MVAANKEATEPRVPLGKVEVISLKMLRSPWLGWPLWNICVTNDHEYVLLVVITSRSFPQSRLITCFVTRLTRRVHWWSRNCLLFQGTWAPRFLEWFVLLDLKFYVYALLIVVCSLVLLLLVIVLSVLLRCRDSNYPFGIFKVFLVTILNYYPHVCTYYFRCVYKLTLFLFLLIQSMCLALWIFHVVIFQP
jgi:hypothetical protein